jgi:putative ABC transport system permease protein
VISLRMWCSRVRALFFRKRLERDLDDELRAHVDLLAEENCRRGMSPEQARQAALREFGGVEQTKEAYREQRSLPLFDIFVHDVRFALRMLAKSPAFAIIAILTLAVGIGATSAVFSVVDRLLFRSLPYPQDERLVSFGVTAPFEPRESMLGPDYIEWHGREAPFEFVTAVEPGSVDCDLTEQNPVHLSCGKGDHNFLGTLGIHPLLGRDFTAEEDRPNAARVALLSYGLWKSRFAGDPQIVGRSLALDGQSTLVIGVLPREFEMPTLSRADFLLPLAMSESVDRGPNAAQAIVRAFARLKPGISIEQAAAGMQPLFEESLKNVPPRFRKEVSFHVRSLRDRQVQDARLASWILLGAVFAVLLVACTNIANLLLTRVASRQRELAVRAALGATRGRLVRQALTESLVLAILGGAAGCGLAYGLVRVFVSIAPDAIPRLDQATIDVRVLLFTLAIAVACGVLSGIFPALRPVTPEQLAGKELRATSRSVLRQALVTAQIALSLLLLAGAGLLLRSLWKIESVSLGMDTKSVIAAHITLAEYRYPDEPKQLAFFDQLESRLKQMPGIKLSALGDTIPPSGGVQATFLSSIEVPGHAKFVEGTGGMIPFRRVTPNYFSVLGVPIVRGRGFAEADRSPAERPVVVSESLAKKLFPGNEEPLGRQFRFGSTGSPWRTIVGIAGDVKNNGLAEPADPEFYLPWKDEPDSNFRAANAILQTNASPDAVGKWLRAEIADIDPTVPVTLETMSERVGKLAERPRFNAVLLTVFAGMGVLLAAIGIYGVVGSLVAQRTREIGVRMALGASPRTVLRMILVHVMRWLLAGSLLGLLGAWFSTRILEALLFEVRARDPLLLSAALMVLLCAALIAAWLPARRAMRVDPAIALRDE